MDMISRNTRDVDERMVSRPSANRDHLKKECRDLIRSVHAEKLKLAESLYENVANEA
jgi:hypothetical protein